MERNYLPPKDPINSLYQIKILFWKDEKQSDTKLQCIFSKFLGQNERRESFLYWRDKIHRYRVKSEFGIKLAEIYSNQNPKREKEPILRIYGNGKEVWDTTQAAYVRMAN